MARHAWAQRSWRQARALAAVQRQVRWARHNKALVAFGAHPYQRVARRPSTVLTLPPRVEDITWSTADLLRWSGGCCSCPSALLRSYRSALRPASHVRWLTSLCNVARGIDDSPHTRAVMHKVPCQSEVCRERYDSGTRSAVDSAARWLPLAPTQRQPTVVGVVRTQHEICVRNAALHVGAQRCLPQENQLRNNVVGARWDTQRRRAMPGCRSTQRREASLVLLHSSQVSAETDSVSLSHLESQILAWN